MKLLTGFFISQKKKQKFIESIEGDKYFLEASSSNCFRKTFFLLKRYSNTDYFPQYFHMMDMRYIVTPMLNSRFWQKPDNPKLLRKLYKVENLVFKYRNDPYEERKAGRIFYILFVALFKIKNIARKTLEKLKISKTKKDKINIYTGSQKIPPVKTAWFRFRFILGYKYCQFKFNNILSKESISEIYHWGPNWTTARLLSTIASNKGIPFQNVEYGEINESFSVNESGMFGDSNFYRNITNNIAYPLDSDELDHAKELVKNYKLKYSNRLDISLISNKTWRESRSKIESLEEIKKQFDGIIYISGVELLYSSWSVSKDGRFLGNPNQTILEKIYAALIDKNYLILYRDHPLAIKQTPSLLLGNPQIPNLIDCSTFPFEYILGISDYVISAPSKVQYEALMVGKKVVSFGECIAPSDIRVNNFVQVSKASECSTKEIVDAFEYLSHESSEEELSIEEYTAYLKRSLII